MSTLSLSPLRLTPDEIAEIVGIYASNPEYCRAAGEYDPDNIDAEQVETDLRQDTGATGFEVLLARDTKERAAGLVSLLHEHPKDGYPWIGLLIVHGDRRRKGTGRLLASMVEERLSSLGRSGIRLAVLENNPTALAFWNSLGWQEIDRRPDIQYGRPCIVMHKQLTAGGLGD
ncbi:GNAT family N-acetyltransferase [Streptomyces sp. NK08204]|uniref:GNAT family N-acetyltransferase n=1 Tax=Streptomyces sp. NK08204 TaxID=2873260 RepID=UPI001CED5410|nr:GNAT family N-acetyltransferase [Streptomyces sp. NK08204]